MYITGKEEIDVVTKIITDKNFFRNQGENTPTQCNIFETNFANYLNCSHALLVNSGTNALFCALKSLDLKEEDEVLVSCFTFFGTISSIINAGAIPVLINIDEHFNISIDELESKVTSKTKALIVVHMDGHPAQMDNIQSFVKKYQISLIEDVAQAIGGTFNNQKLGTIGNIGCFSFNKDKIISCGEGGAIVTNDRQLYEKHLFLHDGACVFGPTFKNQFKVITPSVGFSMRVSELEGGLLNVQLKRLESILALLRENRSKIISALNQAAIHPIISNDESGNCGTSIYLKFHSQEQAIHIFKRLSENKIISIPLIMRAGHNPLQWLPIINRQLINNKINPFDILPTVEIMSRSLKIEVPFIEDQKELNSYIESLIKCLIA